MLKIIAVMLALGGGVEDRLPDTKLDRLFAGERASDVGRSALAALLVALGLAYLGGYAGLRLASSDARGRMVMKGEELRVLIIHTEDAFVAQCLEHDICVQASDLDTLQKRFETAVHMELAERGALDDIDPAPAEFFAKWEQARDLGGAPKNTAMRLAA